MRSITSLQSTVDAPCKEGLRYAPCAPVICAWAQRQRVPAKGRNRVQQSATVASRCDRKHHQIHEEGPGAAGPVVAAGVEVRHESLLHQWKLVVGRDINLFETTMTQGVAHKGRRQIADWRQRPVVVQSALTTPFQISHVHRRRYGAERRKILSKIPFRMLQQKCQGVVEDAAVDRMQQGMPTVEAHLGSSDIGSGGAVIGNAKRAPALRQIKVIDKRL